MSLKKIEEVKKDGGFRPADLIVYAIIALLIAAVFLSVFLTRNTDGLSGIRIFVNEVAVLGYDFKKDSFEILDEERCETSDSDDMLIVTILCDKGFNTVEIDKAGRLVRVTDADCRNKDCLYMKIDDNSGIIYCQPHRLRIIPYGYEGDNGKIIV